MPAVFKFKGVEFRASKPIWSGRKQCVCFLATATFIYVTMFAKYAETNLNVMRSSESDDLMNSSSPNQCLIYPDTLNGRGQIDKFARSPTIRETEASNPDVHQGGWWRPTHCEPRQSVAIIIPYRQREEHMKKFLAYMHPFLQRQQLYYRIYVVEQADDEPFNRGRLLNIGTSEALKDDNWDCLIFHDVDMLPEDDHNKYECGLNPRHYSTAKDEQRYTLIYSSFVGAVLGMTQTHIQLINGFSNMYWGWGSEDDDLMMRIQLGGLRVSRPPSQVGRYKMMPHDEQRFGTDRMGYFANWKERWPVDGMNSLNTLGYTILAHREEPMFTHVIVDVGPRTELKPKTFLQSIADIIYFLRTV